LLSPALNAGLRSNGDKAWFGWPKDDRLEALIDQWFNASDGVAQKALIDRIQTEAYKNDIPYIPTGQFVLPTAYRKNLSGIIIAPVVFLWNVDKQ
jgi:peptide/nickel transport system substrate-binding protein